MHEVEDAQPQKCQRQIVQIDLMLVYIAQEGNEANECALIYRRVTAIS